MHVDASAIVAVLLKEPDREDIIEQLAGASVRTTSIVSAFEAVLAVSKANMSVEQAMVDVRDFLVAVDIRIQDIGDALLEPLCEARRRYGRGSGHKARLNMGDCFSYASAKSLGVPLLYKGDDFAQTDLA